MLPAQAAYLEALQAQVAKLLASQLDGAFSVVTYPAGFNYGITYGPNSYWNSATLHDLDTMLSINSKGQLDLSGNTTFSAFYTALLHATTFTFSQADVKKMNDQDAAVDGQIASILTAFTNAGGTYSNPLPLGGKLQDVFNQLTKQYGGVDHLPDSLSALRNAIMQYKVMAADSYALKNRANIAAARLQAAIANASAPNGANGGMQIDDNTFLPGYTPSKLPTAGQLMGGLNTATNAITISVQMNNFSSTASSLHVEGGASLTIPIAEILDFSIGASASYDMSKYVSSQTAVNMSITYPGVTLVAAIPSALSGDNKTGWYANDILSEIAAKTGQDATGFKIQGSEFQVADLFGPGKVFSRLKTFVISQQPTISITFTNAEISKLKTDLTVNASASLNLLGLFSIGGANANYQVHTVDEDEKAGSVTITFGPPEVSGSVPLQNQIAYVLGGVASYPPDHA
ncbi:MAG: hypothetical protein K2R93_06520 [Gemmatimonadaceae bacterium]|nr:hypothetical protein [Gemmatimonadaceae bacterium]